MSPLKRIYEAICYYNLDILAHMRYLDSLANCMYIPYAAREVNPSGPAFKLQAYYADILP